MNIDQRLGVARAELDEALRLDELRSKKLLAMDHAGQSSTGDMLARLEAMRASIGEVQTLAGQIEAHFAGAEAACDQLLAENPSCFGALDIKGRILVETSRDALSLWRDAARAEPGRLDVERRLIEYLSSELIKALGRVKQAAPQEAWASQLLNGMMAGLAPQAQSAPPSTPAAPIVQVLPSKLHLGCGTHILDGWLNTDLEPQAPGILHLDASKRFPFADDQFDFVFSEHMIEHLDFRGGAAMLRECFRVLKPGGRIRVATPSLDFLLGLYFDPNKELHSRYIRWANAIFAADGFDNDVLYVINNFVRNWGHQFIYNQRLLAKSLMRTGFVDIEFFNINESRRAELADLEFEARLPPGFLQLETMTAEASKPLR